MTVTALPKSRFKDLQQRARSLRYAASLATGGERVNGGESA